MQFSLGLGLGSSSAAGGGGASPVFFTDDFPGAPGSNIIDSVNWFSTPGMTTTILLPAADTIVRLNEETGGTVYTNELPAADHYAKVTSPSIGNTWNNGALIVRRIDDNNWIGANVVNGNIHLKQRLAGVITTLASFANLTVDGDVIEIRAVGNTASVLLNDGEVIAATATDAALAGGLRCGFYNDDTAPSSIAYNFECGTL